MKLSRLWLYILCGSFLSSGCAIDANLSELLTEQKAEIEISEASNPYIMATKTTNYTVTYTGYKDIQLQSSDILFVGDNTLGCAAEVTGSGNVREVAVTGCEGNSPISIQLKEGTASLYSYTNYKGEQRGQVVSAPAVSSSHETIIDNTPADLTFGIANMSVDKDAGWVQVPINISVAKNYDYSESIVIPTWDNTVADTDYQMTGTVSIAAGQTSGSLSIFFRRASNTVGDQILKLQLKSSIWVPNLGGTPKLSYLQIRLVDSSSVKVAQQLIRNQNSAFCGIFTGGELRCWGKNEYGQLGDGTTTDRAVSVQTIASGVISVSLNTRSCAILTGGELRCWGRNSFGQLGDGTTTDRLTPVQVIASGVQSVYLSTNFSCAILTGGVLKCWGINASGTVGDNTTTTRPSPTQIIASGVDSLAITNNTLCALSAGNLKCWGANASGQVGDNTTVNKLVPTQIIASGVLSIKAGSDSFCAILTGGVLKCWGQNNQGQVGDNTTVNKRVPTQIIASGAQSVEMGGLSTCAVLTGGAVKCWGYNSFGLVGDGTTTNKLVPTQIIASGAQSLKAYGTKNCALLDGGALSCWGTNTSGDLGDGTSTNRLIPTTIFTGGVQSLSASAGNCAILTDGKLSCWNSSLGSLAPKTMISRDIASIEVTGTTPANYCALSSAGLIKCFGQNEYGLLGFEPARMTPAVVMKKDVSKPAPLYFDAIQDKKCGLWEGGELRCWEGRALPVTMFSRGVVDFSVGYFHTCAVFDDGSMKCWGANSYGELLDGTTTNRTSPVTANITGVKKVIAGDYSTCVVVALGEVRCWGLNSIGQLGDGTTTNRLTPVQTIASGVRQLAVGTRQFMASSFACAVFDSGALKCWGPNYSGNLGDGTTTSRSAPTQVFASGVKSVALGFTHGCAVFTSGKLSCWGANGNGQLGNGTTTSSNSPVDIFASGVRQVSTSANNTCALLETGEVRCWGANSDGHLGDGTKLARLSPVSIIAGNVQNISNEHIGACAVMQNNDVQCWGIFLGDSSFSIYDVLF